MGSDGQERGQETKNRVALKQGASYVLLKMDRLFKEKSSLRNPRGEVQGARPTLRTVCLANLLAEFYPHFAVL